MLLPFFKKNTIEVGCDEAGRGCLAGPVVAAAVIIDSTVGLEELNDSKVLSETKRKNLRTLIEAKAIAYAVSFVNNQKIDEINILNASILAMHQAIEKLNIKPDFIIVDGNKFHTYKEIPHQCIIKGDGKYMSIAAASILAKTYRDEYMEKIDKEFPFYNWSKNKGYPTKDHRTGIIKNGITHYHRMSYKLLESQLTFKF